MRIIERDGHRIASDILFKPDQIRIGSKWLSHTGGIVEVSHVDFDTFRIYYVQPNKCQWVRDYYVFQMRYNLILEETCVC